MSEENRNHCAPESRAAAAPAADEGEGYGISRPAAGKTILIVEDEPLNRQVITRYFGLLGYRVLQADRGDEGLRLALEESPDVIILDNQLPGLNGIDLCRRLREENRLAAGKAWKRTVY